MEEELSSVVSDQERALQSGNNGVHFFLARCKKVGKVAAQCAKYSPFLTRVASIRNKLENLINSELDAEVKGSVLKEFEQERLVINRYKIVSYHLLSEYFRKIEKYPEIFAAFLEEEGNCFFTDLLAESKEISPLIQDMEAQIDEGGRSLVDYATKFSSSPEEAEHMARRFFQINLLLHMMQNLVNDEALTFVLSHGLDLTDCCLMEEEDYYDIQGEISKGNTHKPFDAFLGGHFNAFHTGFMWFSESKDAEPRAIDVLNCIAKHVTFEISFPIIRHNVFENGAMLSSDDFFLLFSSLLYGDSDPVQSCIEIAAFFNELHDSTLDPAFVDSSAQFTDIAANLLNDFPGEIIPYYILTFNGLNGMNSMNRIFETDNNRFCSDNRIYRLFEILWENNTLNPAMIEKEKKYHGHGNGLIGSLFLLSDACRNPWVYTHFPRVKYAIKQFCFVLFLTIFCSFILFTPKGSFPIPEFAEDETVMTYPLHGLEVVLYIMSLSFIADEVGNITDAFGEARRRAPTLLEQISTTLSIHYSDGWNVFESIIGALFLLMQILRFAGLASDATGNEGADLFNAYYVAMSLNFVLCWINFLHAFVLEPTFGPLIIIVGKMVEDIRNFSILVVSFLCGFSFLLYSYSRMFPADPIAGFEDTSASFTAFVNYVNLLFYSLVGEFDNEMFDGVGNQFTKGFLQIMLAIYIIISLITLFNLLIAMMGTTYQNVSDASFRQYRFTFAAETWRLYSSSVILPPPFTLIVQLIYIPLRVFRVLWGIVHTNEGWHCHYCYHVNSETMDGAKATLASFSEYNSAILPGFLDICDNCGAFKRVADDDDIARKSISCFFLKLIGIPLYLVVWAIRTKNKAENTVKVSASTVVTTVSNVATTVSDAAKTQFGMTRQQTLDSLSPEELERYEIMTQCASLMQNPNAQRLRDLWVRRNVEAPTPDNAALSKKIDDLARSLDQIKAAITAKE